MLLLCNHLFSFEVDPIDIIADIITDIITDIAFYISTSRMDVLILYSNL